MKCSPSADRLRSLFAGGRDGGGGLRGGGGGGRFGADRGAGGRRLAEGGDGRRFEEGGGGPRECWTMVVTADMPLDETWDTAWERTIVTLA